MPDPIPGQEPITPAAPATPPVTPPAEPEDELVKLIKADPSRTAEEIRALRKEAAENRKKAEKAEQDRKDAEAKKLAEQGEYKTLAEKQAEEIKALKDGQRASEIRSAVLLEASRAGIADPQDALKLADLSGVEVKDGQATGAKEAVDALIKAKPYLVKSEPGKPGAPNIGNSNPAGGPSLGVADLKKMSAAEIAAMSPEDYATAMAALQTKKD